MQQALNALINLLKWPITLLALLFFMPVGYRLWKVIEYIYDHSERYGFLLYGMIAYGLLWIFWFKRSAMGQWFATLEHEMTHALFAILSLNKVTGLNATSHSGGVMHYQGYANWVITLSPYFVPTMSFVILLVLSLAKPVYYPSLLFMMGFSMAYHAQSTWHETHRHQPDLQQAGWLFSILFLPTANLLMVLILLTALPNDGLSTVRSLDYVWQDVLEVVNRWSGFFRS